MATRLDISSQLRSASTAWTEEAQRLGNTYVGAKHVLLGLLAVEGAAASEVLRQLGCDLDALKASLHEVQDERPAGTDPDRTPLTREASRAMVQMNKEASRLGSEKVGTEHLLLGLLAGRLGGLKSPNAVADLLSEQCGVTYRKVRKAVEKRGMRAA